MERIAPSQRLREEVRSFLRTAAQSRDGGAALSELVRLATALIAQEGLEAEQRDFIGRDRYERGPRRGHRSGYKPGRVDTAEGRIALELPQVREAGEPYRSKLFEFLRGDSAMVERLAVEMYARGLSTRDVEAAFTNEAGECLLSRSGVSEVTETLWEEYEAFQARSLADRPVLYLFLDGVYEPLRKHGIQKDAVLVAWGITSDGEKLLLSLRLGGKESHEAWLEFGRDLMARGLSMPLTITTDGAPGLIRAVEELWPNSLRLRCWVHRIRNVLAKVPESLQGEVKARLVAIRDAATPEIGEAAARDFLARFGRQLPSACACLSEDLDALLRHLRLPWRHRKFVRTTNLIERSFVEERRRTKTLPRFFTEKSCLKLVHATLIRAATRWRRIHITELEHQQLQLLFEAQDITPAAKHVAVA